MIAGMIFDWIGRGFGMTFLLFAVYVLLFPGQPGATEDAGGVSAESGERAVGRRRWLSEAPMPRPGREPGTDEPRISTLRRRAPR